MVRISIITINFNNEVGLENTIQSVISQNYQNLDYVIIDGKSNDSSLNIIYKYKSYINFYISEIDFGIYDAMNKGIFYSKGDYLFFLNSGDIFSDNNILNSINNIVNLSNPDFIYGDSYELDYFNNKLLKKSRSYKYINFGMFTHHQSMFYSNKIIKNFNLNYSINYKISSDWLFTYHFLNKSKIIIYSNTPICIFERGGISIDFMKSIIEVYKIRRDEFNMPFFINSFFCLLQIFVNTVRFYFPYLYDIIKFKKNKLI